MFIIFSLRQQAFVSKGFNYTSSIREAKQYSRIEVLKACQKHSYNKALDWIPVSVDDLVFLEETIK